MGNTVNKQEPEEEKPLTLEEAKAIIAENSRMYAELRAKSEAMAKEAPREGVISRGIAFQVHPRLMDACWVVEGKDPKVETAKLKQRHAEFTA